MGNDLDFRMVVQTPAGTPAPSLAVAASRAGALGLLNLEFSTDWAAARSAIGVLAHHGRGGFGVLLDGDDEPSSALLADAPVALEVVAFRGSTNERIQELVDLVHRTGRVAYVVATSLEEALAGARAGADAIIARGHEAGGWVGEETAFVLLQRLVSRLDIPILVQGGIGLHTAAACYAGGAAGVVLDNQLLLTRESPLSESMKARLAVMDGSETACLGAEFGAAFRAYARPDATALEGLRRFLGDSTGDVSEEEARRAWRTAVRSLVGWDRRDTQVLAFGQDTAFAAALAKRFGTVGGVLTGIRREIVEHSRAAQQRLSLAEGSPLAVAHGTKYPIVQGPMTRVSDRAEFAAAVANAGALPFLALALLRAPEVEQLLQETRRLLGGRPWGVGVLGFVPPELRAEQLDVIRAYRPPFALIAGGRPDQARVLEADGIATYLHVPSPGLLELFLDDGARRFVFEGRECGGHVGPRTSFVLWESMVNALLAKIPAQQDGSDYHVLLAGGVHDGLSAAMVATLTAPLASRGVRVGVLLGTAYLFTEEAVSAGAILAGYQRAALGCENTVLLETGPGHVTRCVPSPFTVAFADEKRRLLREGLSPDEVRNRLEALNIGRLRAAAKGRDRNPNHGQDSASPKLIDLNEQEQWARGVYMIGQAAALCESVRTLDELHREVSEGAVRRIGELAAPAPAVEPSPSQAAVAVVGMATILPGAADLRTFWTNVLHKVDAITEVPADRWDWHRYYDQNRAARDKVYSRWGGFLADVPFDPVLYGMPPSSLSSIEPFQLLALAVVRAALGDAGYLDRPFARDRTSVILGAGGGGGDLTNGYMVRSSLPQLFGAQDAGTVTDRLDGRLPRWTEDSFAGILMNVAAGRVANRFDLGGVNYTVDAACASSLAAVNLAVRDLEAGTSDVVIVGGVDAIQNPFGFLCFSKTQALSPTGRCRPFDAHADGIAISEGVAVVVLKRLADAERDGDKIYCVIRGVGGSSDGRDRSLTAPRPQGQVRALTRAYAQAGFSPATVGLIEAHGTGTVAGDQAEITALTEVFEGAGSARQACAVGSVKSMIGHTKATAGVAGLVKAAMALDQRVLPPTIGITEPNPKADFPQSPFYVNTEARPWVRAANAPPRRAGVSAFGFGGTNFHVALEEYDGGYLPDRSSGAADLWPTELFAWRGPTRSAILGEVTALLGALERGARPRLSDLAYTAMRRSEAVAIGGPTLALTAGSLDDLTERLRRSRAILQGSNPRDHTPAGIHFAESPLAVEGRLAFLFPGQGSQYVNMARDLALVFPEARACFDRADEVLSGRLPMPLSRYVFPPPPFNDQETARLQAALMETNVAQPALGATGLAYLHVLRALGIEASVVAGHSYGEFVALHAAGCIDESALLTLSEARGRFIREGADSDSGAMAAVDATPDDLKPLLNDPDLTLANINSPRQVVLSGTRDAVDRAVQWCTGRGFPVRKLPVACAFHSRLVAPARLRLAELLRETRIVSPRLPVFSNTTATAYPDEPAAIVDLLSDHLVKPVEFARQVQAMYEAGARLFVEAGPRRVLTGLVTRTLGDVPHACAALDQPGHSSLAALLDGLAVLVSEGVGLESGRLFRGRPVRHLDLASLENETSTTCLSPTTWLVNGGRALPPHQISTRPEVPPPLRIRVLGEGKEQAAGSSNGFSTPPSVVKTNGSTSPADHGRRTSPPRRPARDHRFSTVIREGPTNVIAHPLQDPVSRRPDGASPYPASSPQRDCHPPSAPNAATTLPLDLIRQFQQVMQQFLQTQQTVMHDLLRTCVVNAPAAAPAPPPPTVPSGTQHDPSRTDYPVLNGRVNGHTTTRKADEPVARRRNGQTIAPRSREAARRATLVAPPEAPVSMPASDGQVAIPPPVVTASAAGPSLMERLIEIVVERTGYPHEMLSPDADLESDLGIDSIKRVEVAGTIVRALTWPPGVTPDLERLTGSRTLRQVVEQLEAMLGTPAMGTEGRRPFEGGRGEQAIGRFLVRPVFAPPVNSRSDVSKSGVVVIVDDETGVGERLVELVEARGLRAVRVIPVAGFSDRESVVDADVTTIDGVAELVGRIHARFGSVSALVHLSALGRAMDSAVESNEPWRNRPGPDVESLFLLAKALRPDLERAAGDGGAVVLGATKLGGMFGADGLSAPGSAAQAGIVGLIKTLAHEWPTIRAKAVDFGHADSQSIAPLVAGELLADDGIVEVGYRDGERTLLQLAPGPFERVGGGEPSISRDSVILVTGGARGITAEAAIRLAEAYSPRLVLVGRTAMPEGPEAAATAHLTDARALRQALLDRHRRDGLSLAPAEVENAYRRLLRQREMRRNFERLSGAGVQFDYLIGDAGDAAALAALVGGVYRKYGRIDGVIHGAGIVEDKLIRDKDLESFRRVIKTKVEGALALAASLRPEELEFLVFFSSISARFGNRGQGDYAAANEILNKLAQRLDREWPGRVVSIGWGPWLTAGMVSPEIQRQFTERGVALIPVDDGCRFLEEELRFGRKGEVEVIVGGFRSLAPVPEGITLGEPTSDNPRAQGHAALGVPPLIASSRMKCCDDSVELVRKLDPSRDLYLNDHRIDGRPVLPFAVAMELMAEAAVAGWPGYELVSLKDIRLTRGVVVEDSTTEVRVVARPASAQPPCASQEAQRLRLDVVVEPNGSPGRVHYRSSIELRAGSDRGCATANAPPARLPSVLESAGPLPMSLEETYRAWLFHGPLFQGIDSFEAIGTGGTRCFLRPSSPRACLDDEPSGRWLLDPVVIDSALQVQLIWARLYWDVTLLPTIFQEYRRVVPIVTTTNSGIQPSGGKTAEGLIRHEMRMLPQNREPLCHADHWFFDQDGRLLFTLSGVEAAGSRALNRLAGNAR